MHKALEELADALDSVGATVRALSKETKVVTELWGTWHLPTLSPNQLAAMPTRMAAWLRTADIQELTEEESTVISNMKGTVEGLKPTIIPHIFNGSHATALPPFVETLGFISNSLTLLLGYHVVKDRNRLPANLLKRIRSTESMVDEIIDKTSGLDDKVSAIKDAYEAADELPTTMATLEDSGFRLKSILSESEQNLGRIIVIDKQSEDHLFHLKLLRDEAEKIVDSCGDAYRATTSKGLAASFEESAAKLNTSIKWWIGGLIGALILIAGVGYTRIDLINELLRMPDPTWLMVMTKTAIALLSVGPFVWFAWLATKQIGQRFRMAEDYAFKASVAKAYEGYRREASRIDPKFEAQLFGSALDRVDEAPLRLVESGSYGSPLHELVDTADKQDSVVSTVRSRVGEAIKGRAKSAPKKDTEAPTE